MVITCPEAELEARRLAALITAALDRTPPSHDLDLAGAERTVELLTGMVAGRPVAKAAPTVRL